MSKITHLVIEEHPLPADNFSTQRIKVIPSICIVSNVDKIQNRIQETEKIANSMPSSQ